MWRFTRQGPVKKANKKSTRGPTPDRKLPALVRVVTLVSPDREEPNVRLTITILSLSTLVLLSCSKPPGQVLAEVEWRVECPGDEFNCTPELPEDQTIFQYNGQAGLSGGTVQAQCEATEDATGTFLDVLLEAADGEDTGFMVRNLRLGATSGEFVASPACEVTVTQLGFEYVGTCGTEAPSSGQPCELSDLAVDERAVDGPQISLSVRCTELPSRQNASVRRNIVGQGTATKASLRFADCDGL